MREPRQGSEATEKEITASTTNRLKRFHSYQRGKRYPSGTHLREGLE
ncbi:hypothetical protein [Riemerella anatipestifer]|nr:hypothetical protein [Riemerella anatipestifer]